MAEQPSFYAHALEMSPAKYGKGRKARRDDNGSASFTVDPRQSRVYAFGDNWVYFPAGAICDPATSGYGPDMWDAPCQPLQHPITITAKWTPKGGHGYVDFQPELRFAPSTNPWQWVVISMYDRQMLDLVSDYRILYQVGDDQFVDESLADPTLKAWVDWEHNTVYRRVKHFSGYMIQAGYTSGLGGFSDEGI